MLDALRQHFGFAAFRPGQEEACRAAVDGRDVLVVMPTGAGKSLCYQLPALVRPDLTLVVSPLVSLMQDQVTTLERVAPGRAAMLTAQRTAGENRDALARAASGALSLLYVAPERFSSPGFLDALRQARIGLFVVDEAHCVSQWGHDFRPDYFRLGDAARWLGASAVMASTATATPRVARDVVARLGLRAPVQVTTGFDRPNLSFTVVACATARDKALRTAEVLRDPSSRPAIVYAGTRAATGELARELAEVLGVAVLPYHAGLERFERARTQQRFMDGDVPVVVATNAFGMGIDKADVRTVVHAVVPPSIEAYYQEAGRAGRDGAPARAVLFAEPRDKSLHTWFIRRAEVDDAMLDRAARRLTSAGSGPFDVALSELADDDERARAIIGHLARAGLVQPTPSLPDRARGKVLRDWDPSVRALARSSAAEGTRSRWRQYREVWAFVDARDCRRQLVLRHFGDPGRGAATGPCCDVCSPEAAPGDPSPDRARGVAAVTLDEAIVAVVQRARPSIGRHRVAEVLRGGRSQVVLRNAWDGLPEYGLFAHLPVDAVLEAVDALAAAGALTSSGGPYPVLRAGHDNLEAAA